jgi:hypothetical protein
LFLGPLAKIFAFFPSKNLTIDLSCICQQFCWGPFTFHVGPHTPSGHRGGRPLVTTLVGCTFPATTFKDRFISPKIMYIQICSSIKSGTVNCPMQISGPIASTRPSYNLILKLTQGLDCALASNVVFILLAILLKQNVKFIYNFSIKSLLSTPLCSHTPNHSHTRISSVVLHYRATLYFLHKRLLSFWQPSSDSPIIGQETALSQCPVFDTKWLIALKYNSNQLSSFTTKYTIRPQRL